MPLQCASSRPQRNAASAILLLLEMMWGMAGSDASQPMLCRRISAHHAVLPRLGVLLLRGGGDDGEIGYKVIDDGEDVVGSGRRNSGTWQKGRRKRALEASFVIKAVKSPGSQVPSISPISRFHFLRLCHRQRKAMFDETDCSIRWHEPFQL